MSSYAIPECPFKRCYEDVLTSISFIFKKQEVRQNEHELALSFNHIRGIYDEP